MDQSQSPGSLSEAEKMKWWVATWKRTGPELERLKREEVRGLSEEEGAERVIRVMEAMTDDRWINPHRKLSSGLIEQQRFFGKFRGGSL